MTVYEPGFVISYLPVTVSPLILMVSSPSLSVLTVTVTLSPSFAVISSIVISASFLFALNTLVTVCEAYSSVAPAVTVTLYIPSSGIVYTALAFAAAIRISFNDMPKGPLA